MAKDDRGKDNRPEKEAAKPLPTGSGPAKPADAALKAAGTATPKPVIDLQAREITRPDASRAEPAKAETAQAEPGKTEPGKPDVKPMAGETTKPAESARAPGASTTVPPVGATSASAAASTKPAGTMKSEPAKPEASKAPEPVKTGLGATAASAATAATATGSSAPKDAAKPEPASKPEPTAAKVEPKPIPKPAGAAADAPSQRFPIGAMVVTGVIGGLAGLMMAYGLALAGQWPDAGSSNEAALRRDLAALDQRVRQLSDRPQPPADLAQRLKTLDDRGTALDTRTAALDKALKDLAAAPQPQPQPAAANPPPEAFTALEARMTVIERAIAALKDSATAELVAQLDARVAETAQRLASLPPPVDVAPLTQRLGAVEQELKGIADRVARSTASDQRSARYLAATALKDAFQRGAPYRAELTALDTAGVAAAKTPALAGFADQGAPTAATLAAEYAPLASRLAQAARPAPADAGFFDKLLANAERVVRIRPAGEAEGDAPDVVLSRVEAKLRRGDVIAAATDWRKLPAQLRAEAGPFAQRLETRADAEDAALKIQHDALGPVTQ